jgi:hypothetical protein
MGIGLASYLQLQTGGQNLFYDAALGAPPLAGPLPSLICPRLVNSAINATREEVRLTLMVRMSEARLHATTLSLDPARVCT